MSTFRSSDRRYLRKTFQGLSFHAVVPNLNLKGSNSFTGNPACIRMRIFLEIQTKSSITKFSDEEFLAGVPVIPIFEYESVLPRIGIVWIRFGSYRGWYQGGCFWLRYWIIFLRRKKLGFFWTDSSIFSSKVRKNMIFQSYWEIPFSFWIENELPYYDREVRWIGLINVVVILQKNITLGTSRKLQILNIDNVPDSKCWQK